MEDRRITGEEMQAKITAELEAMDKAQEIADKKKENAEKMKEWKHPR